MLEIKDLCVCIDKKEVLRGVSLSVKPGEVHALMGPNGTGKSTLGFALAGHPLYEVTKGALELDSTDLLALPPEGRSSAGLFLAFQHPVEIPGIKLGQFLFTVYKTAHPKAIPAEFKKRLEECLVILKLSKDFLDKQLNAGMSGGEKKRAEVLQLLMIQPAYAVLDETDSGLDIDSLKVVCDSVNVLKKSGTGCLVITHYARMLDYLSPDCVHVLSDGKIVMSGSKDLPSELEKKGYAWLKEEQVVEIV